MCKSAKVQNSQIQITYFWQNNECGVCKMWEKSKCKKKNTTIWNKLNRNVNNDIKLTGWNGNCRNDSTVSVILKFNFTRSDWNRQALNRFRTKGHVSYHFKCNIVTNWLSVCDNEWGETSQVFKFQKKCLFVTFRRKLPTKAWGVASSSISNYCSVWMSEACVCARVVVYQKNTKTNPEPAVEPSRESETKRPSCYL